MTITAHVQKGKMMKLIDADVIPYHRMWEEDWTKQTIYFGYGVPEWEIDNMPTVDAIPMAWIEDYVKNAGFVSVYNVQSVEFMLRKWREEREEE